MIVAILVLGGVAFVVSGQSGRRMVELALIVDCSRKMIELAVIVD